MSDLIRSRLHISIASPEFGAAILQTLCLGAKIPLSANFQIIYSQGNLLLRNASGATPISIKVLDDAGLRAKGISYSRQHRDRLVKAGKFPPPIALGDNRVGWIESEIEDWLLQRIAARDAALADPVPRPRGRHLKQTNRA